MRRINLGALVGAPASQLREPVSSSPTVEPKQPEVVSEVLPPPDVVPPIAPPLEALSPASVPPEQSAPPGAGAPPPPDPEKLPDNFDEYIAYVKMALGRQGLLPKLDLWAKLAQADAMNRIANELGMLNEFLGAYEEDGGDGEEDRAPLRISDMIAEGVVRAASTLADDEDFMKSFLVSMGDAKKSKKKSD